MHCRGIKCEFLRSKQMLTGKFSVWWPRSEDFAIAETQVKWGLSLFLVN